MSALALASLSGSGFEIVRPVGVLLRGLLVLARGLAKLVVTAATAGRQCENDEGDHDDRDHDDENGAHTKGVPGLPYLQTAMDV